MAVDQIAQPGSAVFAAVLPLDHGVVAKRDGMPLQTDFFKLCDLAEEAGDRRIIAPFVVVPDDQDLVSV